MDLLANFLVAVLPPMLIAGMLLAIRRGDRLVGEAFFAGAFGVSIVAILVTNGIFKPLASGALAALDDTAWRVVNALMVAPILEEALFTTALLLLFANARGGLSAGRGLSAGLALGLGFAMAELFLSLQEQSAVGGLRTWREVAIVRTVGTLPMHAVCGAFIGGAMGWAWRMDFRAFVIGSGVVAAMILHTLWNAAAGVNYFMRSQSAGVMLWVLAVVQGVLLIAACAGTFTGEHDDERG